MKAHLYQEKLRTEGHKDFTLYDTGESLYRFGPHFVMKRYIGESLRLLRTNGLDDLLNAVLETPPVLEILAKLEVGVSENVAAHLVTLKGISNLQARRTHNTLMQDFLDSQAIVLNVFVSTPEQAYELLADFHLNAFYIIGQIDEHDKVGVVGVRELLRTMTQGLKIKMENRVSFYEEFGQEDTRR